MSQIGRRDRRGLLRHEGSDAVQVACLLAPETRAELWGRLRTGELPERARAAVPLMDVAE